MASSCSAGSLHHERTQDITVISRVHANLETAATGRNKAKEEFFTGNHRLVYSQGPGLSGKKMP